MNPRRIFAVFARQWFLLKSNPTRLTSILVWIFIDIIQWGFISKYLGTFGKANFSFITVILGAIILLGFMGRIQQGLMMAFLEDVWSQNFINFFASPLAIREYLAGLALSSMVTSLFGFTAMTVVAGAAFGYNVFKIGILLLPFMFILIVFGVAVGIFVSGVIFRFGTSAEWLAWPIPMVLSIFSGAYYPLSTLPDGLRIIALLLPPAYVFESLRGILSVGGYTPEIGHNMAAGTALAFAYLFAMYLLFQKIYRDNLESGGMVKFNAEGI
ncbi:MAG: ABC transporter permease [Nitrospinae bacterium]|nr:ABC transporter permease [Nitrospinota bacterium]